MNLSDPRSAYFDSMAADWDATGPSAQAMTACLAGHADILALQPGESLLEVGCGTGKTTGWLAARVAPGRVTAVDFAPAMVMRARSKGIDADFHCMDVCRDALGSELYDVILCFHSFPHFRDQPAALRNFALALKPAGRLIVMHLAGSARINRFHAELTGPVRGDALPRSGDWPPLLAAAGLKQADLVDREDLFLLQALRDR